MSTDTLIQALAAFTCLMLGIVLVDLRNDIKELKHAVQELYRDVHRGEG